MTSDDRARQSAHVEQPVQISATSATTTTTISHHPTAAVALSAWSQQEQKQPIIFLLAEDVAAITADGEPLRQPHPRLRRHHDGTRSRLSAASGATDAATTAHTALVPHPSHYSRARSGDGKEEGEDGPEEYTVYPNGRIVEESSERERRHRRGGERHDRSSYYYHGDRRKHPYQKGREWCPQDSDCDYSDVYYGSEKDRDLERRRKRRRSRDQAKGLIVAALVLVAGVVLCWDDDDDD
ncbi:hypothetical protein VTJ49DRAFT_6206 [Mycothermus thermophilus]|uniref:Uncharacterized protein n=1 Tax=Humicola insolens TaxID=85995 RepID=A0ABR3V1N7_HUMIN